MLARKISPVGLLKLLLLDLDETLLPTQVLRSARHGQAVCDLTQVAGYRAVAPYPGLPAVLTELAHRVPLALVSSSPRWYVDQLLRAHLSFVPFEVIVTYDDVTAIKPDPEPLLLALARTQVESHEALYVGDDLVDYGASAFAGIAFLGAGWAQHTSLPTASIRLPSPTALLNYVPRRS